MSSIDSESLRPIGQKKQYLYLYTDYFEGNFTSQSRATLWGNYFQRSTN